MSNCPNCGSPESGRYWIWACGKHVDREPTMLCKNIALRRDLAQANAVIDTIANAKQIWNAGLGIGSYTGGETNAGFACRLQQMARDRITE